MRKNYVLAGCLVAAVLVAAALLIWFLNPGPKDPTASFVLKPDAGEAPLEVKFDGSESSNPDGAIADFAWDFGDGQTATGQVTSHKYGAPGTFTVKLTVTNKKGAASSVTKSITVTEGKAMAQLPLFAEIEPADGAVVQGTETWIRWHAPTEAKGKVLWRKAGEAEFQSVDALNGDPLLARLAELKAGEKYEYVVEQSGEAATQRSNLRTFTAQTGLGLEPAAQEQLVQRDYNQTVKLTLHNTLDKKVVVAAKALAQFEDLPADVVGRGSVDEPVELAPGEKLDLRLAVTATDATRETYEIPIEAGGASTVAHVRVAQPKLQLSFKVIKESPYTLAKTIEIRNEGTSSAGLAVRVTPPHHVDVSLDPATGHAYLESGKSLQIVATPILYLEFQSLKTELECLAGGQSVLFPLEFKAPAGKRLIGVRSRSGETTRGQDWFCPNHPNTCSVVPGPGGNGSSTSQPVPPVVPPPEAGAGGTRVAAALAIVPGGGAGGGAAGPQACKPKQGSCDEAKYKCANDCWDNAKKLKHKYDELAKQLQEEKKKKRTSPELQPGDDGKAHVVYVPVFPPTPANPERIRDLAKKLEDIKAEWEALKKHCEQDCNVCLGDIDDKDWKEDLLAWLKEAIEQTEDKLTYYEKLKTWLEGQCVVLPESGTGSIEAEGGVQLDPEIFKILKVGGVDLKGKATIEFKYKPKEQCEQLLTLLQKFFTLDTQVLLNRLKDLRSEVEKDPPLSDYWSVVTPSIAPLPPSADASDLEQLSESLLRADRWAIAYLEAYITSLKRYQGARNDGAHDAMVKQAEAMERFADQLLAARRQATLLRHLLEATTLGFVEQSMILLAKKQVVLDTDRAERLKLGLGAWKAELEATREIQKRLLESNSGAVWPEPTEIVALRYMEGFAGYLRRKAEQAKSPGSEQHDHALALGVVALRPGLLNALQRRASFTRAHRGAFAAILEGDAPDSSDTPAGWHAGERVCYVWHQEDKIAFASFDPRGEVVMEPQVIGKGRWPRVTADGNRTAVAWSRDDGFVVRVHDGKQWGEEVALTGREAAIALAPDGRLFAATSKGLWKLTGKTFERVQDTAYSQPALAIDDKGQPQVAWRRDGRIVFQDKAVDEGERPTLAVAADGTIHLAYLSKGAIVVRSRKGEDWTPAVTISAKNPSWPTLARSEDGMRLSYLGAADPGPDALWLVRLPDKEPVLIPSLAANVTEAALLVDLRFSSTRWAFRPYDLWLSVNDVVVQTFSNTVPEGRYLVKLNPYQVFTSSGRPAPNRIAIHSWHMNAGHYATIGDYHLMVRTAWNEHYAFAASEKEVQGAADNPRINHDRPDLTVLANGLELPVDAPKSGPIDFPVTVANLGEAASKPARLVMLDDKKPLAQTAVPALKPGEKWEVTMRLNGRLEMVTFRVEQDQPDFDPTNDALTVHLWTAEEAALDKSPVGTVVASSLAQVGMFNKGGAPLAFTVLAKDGSEVARGEAGRPGVLLPAGEFTLQTGATKIPITVPAVDKLPAQPDFLAQLKSPSWYSNLRVNANNANFTFQAADGRLVRWYNSRSLYDGPFGFGWTFDYGTRLEKTKDGFQVQEPDGFTSTYRETDPGKYATVVAQIPSTLEQDKEQMIRRIEGIGYLTTYGRYVTSEVFDAKGRLVTVRFATGEVHEVRYAADALKSVVDQATAKSVYDFETNKDGKVTSLVDSTGRRFRYTYDGKVLSTATGPDGAAARYRYSNGMNLTEARYADKSQANLEYNEEKDWLVRLRAAGIDHRFAYGEDSPKHFWTIRTDQEGSVVRWDFDEEADGNRVTTIERLDGKISRLLAQMGLADADAAFEPSGSPSDLANQIGWLGRPALDAIQQRLQSAKNPSPERLQRAASVLEGVRVSSPSLTTKVSALVTEVRNRLAEATKGQQTTIVRLDDSGRETARYALPEGDLAGRLTRLDATHVVVGEFDSQRLQVLDLATKQFGPADAPARKVVGELRTDLGDGRQWRAAGYVALLQLGARPALHVLPEEKEKNTKGYTRYFADFGSSAPELGVMASETLVLAARGPGFPVLSINLATGESRRLAEGPVRALTSLGEDVWALYPDRVVQYKAAHEQGLVIRLPKDLGKLNGFTPLGDGTILLSVVEPSARKPGGP